MGELPPPLIHALDQVLDERATKEREALLDLLAALSDYLHGLNSALRPLDRAAPLGRHVLDLRRVGSAEPRVPHVVVLRERVDRVVEAHGEGDACVGDKSRLQGEGEALGPGAEAFDDCLEARYRFYWDFDGEAVLLPRIHREPVVPGCRRRESLVQALHPDPRLELYPPCEPRPRLSEDGRDRRAVVAELVLKVLLEAHGLLDPLPEDEFILQYVLHAVPRPLPPQLHHPKYQPMRRIGLVERPLRQERLQVRVKEGHRTRGDGEDRAAVPVEPLRPVEAVRGGEGGGGAV
mmetsp:Transcript_7143/g.14019  ORF Transcript_7143/g.14019 Transcript_7143/m.14019 type:complete len:292 (-) Transcript_7143:703-1578(-)